MADMNPIAFTIGSHAVYWSAVIIALAAAACFTMTCALFTSHGGHSAAVWLLLPLAVAFSVLLSRILHWYCHVEQYSGFWKAVTDYSSGGYVLTGALLGTVLAGLLVRALGFTGNLRRLFDCLAPGAALGIALIRLSALFENSCRGKIVVENPALQHLPLASAVSTVDGGTEYCFATFFVQFLLMLLLFWLLLRFFQKRRRWPMKADQPRDGNVALMFLCWYSAVELVADSTRYDSSFMPINGFVSMVQVVSAVTLLGVLIVYTVRSVRANGRQLLHWLLWGGFWLAVAGAGVLEYLIQRHGNWYLFCYPAMSLCSLAVVLVIYRMYKNVCGERRRKKPAPRPE